MVVGWGESAHTGEREPERERERERERESERVRARTREREFERKRFGSSFYMFFFHLGLPYANWA